MDGNITLVCPRGARVGQTVLFRDDAGRRFSTEVPAGVKPGDKFTAKRNAGLPPRPRSSASGRPGTAGSVRSESYRRGNEHEFTRVLSHSQLKFGGGGPRPTSASPSQRPSRRPLSQRTPTPGRVSARSGGPDWSGRSQPGSGRGSGGSARDLPPMASARSDASRTKPLVRFRVAPKGGASLSLVTLGVARARSPRE